MRIKEVFSSTPKIYCWEKNYFLSQLTMGTRDRKCYFLSQLQGYLQLIKLRFKKNNYLLTGKKVQLFSPRQTRGILLVERSETNNSPRVCRGEKRHFLPVNT